jgi:tetratricopeptide (TPR) repeat protein
MMPDSHAFRHPNDLYCQCFEQLLPIAQEQIQSVDLDWWDLDSFLGLAFYLLLTKTDPQLRAQVTQLLPKFGAKAVSPLVVIGQHQQVDPALRVLATHTLHQFETGELVTGLLKMLKASEDERFDQPVTQILVRLGSAAQITLEALETDQEWQALASRMLLSLRESHSPRTARREMALAYSCNFSSSLQKSNATVQAETLNALLQSAAAKAETQAYRQAIDIYTQVIHLCPENACAYGDRGLLRSNLGDQQGAITDISCAAHLFYKQGRTANFEIALGYLNAMTAQPLA